MRTATGTTNAEFPSNVSVGGTHGVTGLLTATSGVSVPDGAGLITTISASNRALAIRSGTVLNIGENGGWSAINYRLPTGGTHSLQVAGSTIASVDGSGLAVTGTATATGKITGSDTVVGTLGGRFGALKLTGRFIDQTTTVTSGTTALGATHSTVFANATAGNITLNLPAASGLAGLTYTVFKIDATANTVTVDGNSSETIGGDLTVVLGGNASNSQLVIVCDGSNWAIKTLYEEGSFTAAATGMSACTVGSLSGSTCTGTAYYTRNRKAVLLYMPQLLGTSSSTSLTITGLPSFLSAARQSECTLGGVNDNSNNYIGYAVLSSTTLTLSFRNSLTTYPGTNPFTASGLKGNHQFTFMYTLQ
jgi:hypothetical protein